MAQIQFTNAPSGSGKTYGRCARFLCYEFLPYKEGDIWSNYPIKVDEMIAFVKQHHPHLDEAKLRSRIKFIPQDALDAWRSGQSHPSEFFKDKAIDGAHIAIDEIHNFCHATTPKPVIQEWKKWLGEIRHCGATFECLTQTEMKVNKAIRDEASLQRYMFNTENKADPFFGIKMEDWYELRAGFLTGEYIPTIIEQVRREEYGKMVVVPLESRRYQLHPELFPVYDSYSAPVTGGQKSKGREYYFKKLSKPKLIIWFLRRNVFSLTWRLCILVFGIWLCFFGGMVTMMNGFGSLMASMGPQKKPDVANVPQKPTTPSSATHPQSYFADPQPLAPGDIDKKLLEQIAKLNEEIETHKKTIAALKAEAASFSEIVALFGNQVTLRSGITVEVNEQIPIGPLKGRTIKGISHEKRRVILDDNTVLPLTQ